MHNILFSRYNGSKFHSKHQQSVMVEIYIITNFSDFAVICSWALLRYQNILSTVCRHISRLMIASLRTVFIELIHWYLYITSSLKKNIKINVSRSICFANIKYINLKNIWKDLSLSLFIVNDVSCAIMHVNSAK